MLPSKLAYQSKVEPSMAKSQRFNLAPQNGTGPYLPNDTIIFNLPTRNNLCFVPSESYLKFTMNYISNATAPTTFLRLDANGIHSVIRRIRCFHGSNLISDIDNYEVLSKIMFDLQANYPSTTGKLSITTGTRSEMTLNKPTILSAATDTAANIATQINSISNKVTIPNHGHLINDFVLTSSGAIAPIARIPVSTTVSQTYCINLISIIGTLCNEKYFPLFACKSAPLRVEIQLVPSLNNVVAASSLGSFNLTNVEYVMNTIELSDNAMGIIQNSLNGEPLQFCVTDYRNYVWNGAIPATSETSFSVPINAKFSSLKSILVAARDSAKTGGLSHFPNSCNKFSLSQYFFRIGANILPSKFPTTSSEYLSEVLKAVGSLSDLNHSPALNITDYTQDLPIQNNDSFTTAATAGTDTYQYSNVSSGSFYTGIDLENYATADRTNIFAGYNSNTDDIFYVPTFASQAAIGNIRFDSFAMFDAVLVFQNDTVYCKF
jgi:hypothetical protein